MKQNNDKMSQEAQLTSSGRSAMAGGGLSPVVRLQAPNGIKVYHKRKEVLSRQPRFT